VTLFTQFGPLRVEFRGKAIYRIEFPAASASALQPDGNPEAVRLCADLARYFAGEKVSFFGYRAALTDLPDFTRQVLRAARRIPYGKCCTYGELARRMGRPKAARAVGQALRRNPLPIVIPCHRVVGKGGDLRGFAGGVELKRQLLNLEAKCAGGTK